MTGPVIDVEALEVRYGRAVALDGVTLSVAASSVYALLGRNGAGKSSLVRCMLGQRPPSAGRVALFGRDSWRHRHQLMARLGVVPEEPDAPPSMTANQLGRFSSRLYPRWDADGYAERLRRFRVPEDTAFGRLSKGEKAQVMLSLALASEPRLLILDDPTLGLDAVARRAVYEELVVELADRETTVFVTSHDLAGVESIATHVALLAEHKILFDEDLEALKYRFRRVSVTQRVASPGDASPGDASPGDASPSPGDDEPFAGLEPIDVKARGRGVEALVARFDEAAIERLRGRPDVESVEVWPAALEDIVIALTEDGRVTSR